ncbi:MAG: MotA/TolQ/ExbB proton channel family protein, partial [Roseateles sp.]
MTGFDDFWAQSDVVGRAVALLLLAMSVSAWALILWKAWLLRRARRGLLRAVPAFWSAAGVSEGRHALQAFDT